MKKIYFIMISVILTLALAVGCTEPQNTEPPINSDNWGSGDPIIEIPLPTFIDYNEYLEYLQTIDLPENFVHAKEFLNLGTFDCAVFWIDFTVNRYMYTFVDENNNDIDITFEMISADSPTDITKYLMEEYEERNTQNQRFAEYSADLFVNNNLLQCYNEGIWVTDVRIGDMNYHYWGGKLGCIHFIRNGLLCTVSWYNRSANAQNEDDGSFLLESNNAVSKLIFASTAEAGFSEICGKITTEVKE